MKRNRIRLRSHRTIASAGVLAILASGTAFTTAVQAEDAVTDPWKVDVYYENDTHFRGKDKTGETVGLSKFRNTLQVEADKRFGGWNFHGIFRGSFDGVYRMNADQYGNSAGSRSASDVQLQNTAGPVAASVGAPLPPQYLTATVPFGGGVGYTVVDAIQAAAGLPNLGGPGGGPGINRFLDSYGPNNPGTGLRLLGDRWHGTSNSGVEFAVPVRPCDKDSRGCVDFGGYGDLKRSELEAPEFNNRLDFIREAYVTNSVPLGDGKELFLKLGRQQVVWGRTDLFRVLDVINPVDYSRNNIYDELQDIRIPMWILSAEYRMGAGESMQDRNIQLVWNIDKFRPDNLGQCGTPNVILDAGCFFRGMKNLWENGGTVANFAPFAPPGVPGPGTGPWFATNFGPNQIGIRDVHLPEWSLGNTQFGVKFEGVTKGGLSFSLNALTYRSQLPSLHSINGEATNAFTGAPGNTSPFSGPAQGIPTTHLIAFDMFYPRVNLIGGSMDFQWEEAKAAVRIEAALTDGEEFPNTARPDLFSKNKVFRSVIGFDRPTFIPFINPNRTTLISAQLFYQHIFNHELSQGLYGPVGMPDWKDNAIGTLLVKAFLANDRVSPQIITAYDVKARALVIAPAVEWLISDTLKLTVGGNFKTRDNDERWAFDDCRSCNPWAPYSTYAGETLNPGSAGVGGIEPLGRFRAGPIGTAWKENEVYLTLRYKF